MPPPIQLDQYRDKQSAIATKRKRHEEALERLSKTFTLGLKLESPLTGKEGPHFAWVFLEPQWISDLIERIEYFRKQANYCEFVEEVVFRDYLVHFGMGDIMQSEEAFNIKRDLQSEEFMLLPLDWDCEDDDPSYRTTPDTSLLVISEEGVKWRMNYPHHPMEYFQTTTVPHHWFYDMDKIVK